MRKEIFNKCKRGVFTTEASFIVPMIVVMMALLLILNFYVGNRNWYSCAAYEAALKGNGVLKTDGITAKEAAEASASARIKDQVLLGFHPSSEVTSKINGTTVSFQGDLYTIFKGKIPSLKVTKEVEKFHPEAAIRIRWIKDHFQGMETENETDLSKGEGKTVSDSVGGRGKGGELSDSDDSGKQDQRLSELPSSQG